MVKFEGEEDIGMVVGSADTKNIVVEVIDGMAADRAGIQVGDELRKYSMDPRVKMKDGLPFKDDSMPFINGLPPGKVIRIQVNTSSSDSDAYKSRSKHIRRVMVCMFAFLFLNAYQ